MTLSVRHRSDTRGFGDPNYLALLRGQTTVPEQTLAETILRARLVDPGQR